MKTEKLNNFLGLCLLIAIVLSVVTFLIIKPSITRAGVTSDKIKATNADIVALHTLATKTDELRNNYAAVKDHRDQILHQLPSKSEEERLLALLSALGKQSGVIVTSFVPTGSPSASSSATASSISPYPAAISITGTYAQEQDFLRKIENGARFIDLQTASFSSGEKGSLSGGLLLQAYYQNDTSSASAATTTGGSK